MTQMIPAQMKSGHPPTQRFEKSTDHRSITLPSDYVPIQVVLGSFEPNPTAPTIANLRAEGVERPSTASQLSMGRFRTKSRKRDALSTISMQRSEPNQSQSIPVRIMFTSTGAASSSMNFQKSGQSNILMVRRATEQKQGAQPSLTILSSFFQCLNCL